MVGTSPNPMPDTNVPISESSSMKIELKNFMKKHLTSIEPSTDASFMSANDFSPLPSTFSNF
jgi:hypothetical protein